MAAAAQAHQIAAVLKQQTTATLARGNAAGQEPKSLPTQEQDIFAVYEEWEVAPIM